MRELNVCSRDSGGRRLRSALDGLVVGSRGCANKFALESQSWSASPRIELGRRAETSKPVAGGFGCTRSSRRAVPESCAPWHSGLLNPIAARWLLSPSPYPRGCVFSGGRWNVASADELVSG